MEVRRCSTPLSVSEPKPILIVDGNNVLHACFFKTEFFSEDLRAQETLRLFKERVIGFVRKLHPSKTYVAWDSDNATAWRKSIFPNYKGTRPEKHVALREALSEATNINFNNVKVDMAEGDDTIYALCKIFEGKDITIVSSDKDFLQIPQEQKKVRIFNLLKNDYREIPEYDVALMKSLSGDTSDNLTALVGIGEKKALKLMESNLTTLTPEQHEIVEKHLQVIKFSKNPNVEQFKKSVAEVISKY